MVQKLHGKFLWFLFFLPALVWGQACPTSVPISANPGNNVCDGTEVTFTATSSGGTGTLSYQWQINSANQGSASSSNTFTPSSLSNGDKIRVIVTSSDDASCSRSSSQITMTINSLKTPTVNISSSPSTKCVGENVTFTAANTNAGSNPTYSWFVNGNATAAQTSSSNTFSTSGLPVGANSIRVVLSSSLTCVTSATAENTANITITDNASINTPGNKDQANVCISTPIDPIVFNIGGSGNGASVVGLPPGVSGNYSSGNFTISGSPSTTGTFNYTVTTSGSCESVAETGSITVLNNATISLSSSNNVQEVCQDEAIQAINYNIGETGTGANVTGLPAGISGNFSGGVFTISGSSSVTGTHNYSITATGTCGDSNTLNGSISINENLEPSVSITSSDADSTICAGTEVTFTANATNGGSSPSYQWQINGANAGTNNSSFTTSSLSDGDTVTVILTSDETCVTQSTVTSNTIAFTVNPNLTPSVTITASDSDICTGDTVDFSIDFIENQGTNPTYQWKLDGANVGGNSDTFSTSNLTDGQVVSLVITSSETCLATATATSNEVVTIVNPNLTPEITIVSNDADNIICSGSNITFNATPVYGGSNPSYQWYVDGSPVGSGGASFNTAGLTDGQTVKVLMTSDEECLALNTAESNEITVQVDNSITGITPAFDTTNPAHNSTAICPVTEVVYKVNPIPGARSYNWTYPSGWTVVSQNGNLITLKAGTNAQSGNISVTAVNNCGNSATLTESVSTGTVVLVDAGPDQNVCIGTNQVNLAGQIGGVITKSKDWSWSASVSGGSFSNGGNNLTGTYSLPNSIRNNGGTVTITITSIDPSGPCGPKTDSMVLTVVKNATISNPSNKNQSVCVDNSITNIDFNITDAGTGATVSGLPAGVNGSFNAGIFTVSGTPTEAGVFNYTVNTTGNCTGQQTSQSGTITVSPDHTISDPANKVQEICINTAIENILFTTNESVTDASVSGLPAGLSGVFASGTYTINGTATEAGTFDYTVTTIGNCNSTSQTGTITVKPDPTIDTPVNVDQEVCINAAIDNIQFNISEPATGANVTGLPAGLTGNFNNGVYTISGSPSEDGEFIYEVVTTGGCEQVSSGGTITVIPDPTATIVYPGSICTSITGSVNVTLDGTGDYQGGTFSATPNGLTISPSSGAITPGSSTPGEYTITYTGPDICEPAIATAEVTINAVPYAELSYEDPFCTSDENLQNPIFTNGVGDYENGVFSSSEPGGLELDPVNGIIYAKTSSPGTYDVFYTIAADPDGTGCGEVILQTEVVITQSPQVIISYPETICSTETVGVTINGEAGNWENGTFSGTNGLAIDSDGNIDATSSSPGPHTITYTIESASGCEEVISTADIIIKETPVITTNPVNTGTCSNSPAEFEVIATGDDLNYQWYKIVGGTPEAIPGEDEAVLYFSNATSVDAAEYYVVVSGDDACTEATSETVTLNVDEDIVITEPTEDITICEDEEEEITFVFMGYANGAPLTFDWIKDGEIVTEIPGKIDIDVSGPSGTNGEYTGTLTIIDPQPGDDGDSGVYWVSVDGPDYFTCPEATSKTFTFRVEPRPEPPTVTSNQYCLNEDAGNLTADGEAGNEIKWYTYDSSTSEYSYIGDNIEIDTDSPAVFEYYATQTRANGCESDYSEMMTITILDTPDPVSDTTLEFEFCKDEEVTEALSVTPADGATLNWYDSIDSDTALGSAPVPETSSVGNTTYYVSQTFSSTGCESDRTAVDINIKPLPNVDVQISGDASTICLGSTVTLNASGADSYTWMQGEMELYSGTDSSYDITPTEIGENIYTIIGEINGCTNTYNITINVDDTSVAGLLTPDSDRVCISEGEVSITLESRTGAITKWEYNNSTTGGIWVETEDVDLNDTRTFSGLTESTSYRVTVKNGVCDEVTAETTITVDQLPEGGKALWAKNNDRLFLTCQNPVPGFASRLNLSGYTGEIIRWEYRGASDTSWQTINGTTAYLTPEEIESVITDESTAFRALIANNSCDSGIYSETAIVSVIVADIKPAPVEVDKDVICIGDQITLSSETGYSAEGGKFDGGAFDNAGIKNHGWDFTNPDGSKNDFDSAANNGRADHWLRMNPHGNNPNPNEKVYTAHLFPIADQSPTNGYRVNFRTFSTNAGNKGFALVTGDNSSLMETPVFSLGGLDEAILTWDQAYNLTEGARIQVEISTNGGGTYDHVVFDTIGTATSGNYDNFGDGTPATRPLNKMVVDLGDFLGMSNLRIRFNYVGTIDGDVWAVDNIEVPEGPQDILLQWYYDDDLNDPENYLEPIGEVNQGTVTFEPRKIGWNDFEVQTRIILDSNGDQCQSIDNFETIRVWAFDRYTTEVTAEVGACGSLTVSLNATVTADFQATTITEYPTLDGYVGSWQVEDLDGNVVTTGFEMTNLDPDSTLDPMEDPQAIFTAESLGEYNFKWILTPTAVDENDNLIDNSGCPPIENPNNVTLIDCTTLDFDGDDDYIDLGNNYNGNYFIEAWIRPFDRPIDGGGTTDANTGVIFSSSGFEISMDNLASKITKNDRWYHIAVANNGQLWVDGIPSGSISTNGSGINNTSIGARYNANTKTTSNHFSGWIDELRIWNGNNPPDLKELRFMMNQRIKLNDAATAGSLIEGEVVPNLEMQDGISSYYTDGTHNLDQDGDQFYNQTWGDLAGYYRLVSDDPDPAGLTECATFADNLKPLGGYTPDHSINAVPGRLVNITTNQENTSPTPYCSGADATWANKNTWARPTVWDYPNSTYDGTAIEWNIARVNHNITSGDKDITMLGLLSETAGKELSIIPDHFIRISHYLLLDGNMDLEGESQLLQDHGSLLDNSSGGWAQANQKGRMSSYNYNYWTSPFTNQGANNNSGFKLNEVLYDGDKEKDPDKVNFQNGYFVADKPKTSPITISNEWIWDFRGGDADIYGDWLFLGSDYPEIVGAGYSMKGTDGTVAPNAMHQKYTFQGKPNNGNIPTTELYLQNNQNFLVGNPYPSAIDAITFLKENLVNVGTGSGNNENGENVFNGTLYYWDHFSGSTHILEDYIGGYATYTLAGNAPAIANDWRISAGANPLNKLPKQYIPVAQGFFLNSAPVGSQTFGGEIIFKNTQRAFVMETEATSEFLQQEDEIVKGQINKTGEDDRMKIRVKFESPKGYHRQILVTRDENTSNGFDIGYDAPLIENNMEDMYWWFGDHGFVIQGVPDFEKDQILPLAIKTNAGGEFKIKIDETENWPEGKELYLKDKISDSIHDILKEDYLGNTEDAGEIVDRFELIFFKEQAEDPIDDLDPDDILNPDLPVIDGLVGISYSTFSKQVMISNFDLLEVERVMIFDIGGKLIQEYDELPTEKEIRLGMRPVRSGIYIVKVFSENGISNKKIIVK
ncbi:T9SS type A sorting domain-containing protein [Gramella lutea]|uniref:T9SS type A sorting domain-containing protein n=1 Tax=Christiangramia lutea TaxID=1607951 RepID=A0A9X1V0Q0_9FLAO|nr:T9SS type A sorting domain-containing protein [Christiangramia lutea]MCH4821720.1 T9SS type A sorting domain-containing protein [Christiangramia lutea]